MDQKTHSSSYPDVVTLYILPQKIQKRRYEDLKAAAVKRGFNVTDKHSGDVTHVVTELECREKVLKYIELGDNDQTTVELLTIHWFIECMKANAVVPVEERHRVRSQMIQPVDSVSECSSDGFTVAEWACQRITPLTHHNTRFTHALETLQEYAELRGSDSYYSRALAFRRASCVLKCFPYPLSSMRQLQQIKDIGDHSKRVIQEILEDGESREVESIKNETWFQKMKMFSSVFGIGPSKAKNWISRGWTSVDDAQRHIHEFSDWRIIWGLSFHDDLTTPVIRTEAEAILDMVSVDVTALCPGAIITLIGGFRRGKPAGHDVDLLITHPEEGKERGLLAKLVQRLTERGVILCGHLEKSTYTDHSLFRDTKLNIRGQLDHFEKWLGMFKLDNYRRNSSESSSHHTYPLKSLFVKDYSELNSSRNSNCDNAIDKTEKLSNIDSISSSSEAPTSSTCTIHEVPVLKRNRTIDKSADDFDTPLAKKAKILDKITEPLSLSAESRNWLARRVDLIIAPYSQYFYAMVGWTGNKHFNRDLRLYAQRVHNMKLTSHGLYDLEKMVSVPAETERQVFDNLRLDWREPDQRNC